MKDEPALPPLPQPFIELHRELSPTVYAAWADQLRAYALEAVKAEREAFEAAMTRCGISAPDRAAIMEIVAAIR